MSGQRVDAVRIGAAVSWFSGAATVFQLLSPLKWLGLFSLETRRIHRYLRAPSSAQRAYRRAGEGLFTSAGSHRTRDIGFKWEEGQFGFERMWKLFFFNSMIL